jgi:predicted Ser/Thr protein kinase
MISQIGAWSLDHPSETVTYSKVFPEYWAMLEKHYFESQKALLSKMHDALIVYANDTGAVTEEGRTLANKTVTNMVSRLGYCEHCAKEVITFLMRQRY